MTMFVFACECIPESWHICKKVATRFCSGDLACSFRPPSLVFTFAVPEAVSQSHNLGAEDFIAGMWFIMYVSKAFLEGM